jgi:hypothetical protein
LVAVFVSLAAHGVLTPEATANCLVGLVAMLAIGWAMGTGLIGSIIRIGIPIISVLAVAQYYGGGNGDAAVKIVAQLCELGLVLFGIFILVTGPFRR